MSCESEKDLPLLRERTEEYLHSHPSRFIRRVRWIFTRRYYCPVCDKVTKWKSHLEYFNDVPLLSHECKKCGFEPPFT